MTGPFEVEALEGRKLLSATLSSHHVLYVVGTPHSDAITLELERHHPGVLNVTVNGSNSRFYTASIRGIVLQNGRGKDSIVFNDRYGKIPGQPMERKNHHENCFVAADDGTDVTVDDYFSDVTTDDGSGDVSQDDSGSGDDGSSDGGSGSSTQPTSQPTTQPTDGSGDGSDSGNDSGADSGGGDEDF
jgi:hypothetical protein